MANNYEKNIKPFLKDIGKLVEHDAPIKQITEILGISYKLWTSSLENEQELRFVVNNAKLNRSKLVKKQLKNKILEYENEVPYEYFKDILRKRVLNHDDLSTDEIIKIIRQIYPEHNHYLQIQKEKNEIERMRVEAEINANSEIANQMAKISIINDAFMLPSEENEHGKN